MKDAVERSDRLDSLSKAIHEGTYTVEAMEVADSVLRSWTMADVVEAWCAGQADSTSAASSSASKRWATDAIQ